MSGSTAQRPRDSASNSEQHATARKALGSLLFWFAFGAVGVFFWWSVHGTSGAATAIDYSQFRSAVQAGSVKRIAVSGDQITGTLKKPAHQEVDGRTVEYTQFTTYLPSLR